MLSNIDNISSPVATDAAMVVAANNRGTCFVWRLDAANQFEPLHKVDAHTTYCIKAVLSPDSKCVKTGKLEAGE